MIKGLSPAVILIFLALFWAVWIGYNIYHVKKLRAARNPSGDQLTGPTGCLTLARRVDPTGFARRFRVLIDGRRVGLLSPGEVAHFPIATGKHTVAVRMDWYRSESLTIEMAADTGLTLWCGARYNDWRCMPMAFLQPHRYLVVEPHTKD